MSERKTTMNNYEVYDKHGDYREFAPDSDGLEEAKSHANEIGSAVLQENEDGYCVIVWNPLEDLSYDPLRFDDPVDCDSEWLASAGYGTDEDYGYASEVW